jgi:histidinol phosphatase-like PHP family hydrolase
LNTKEDYHIHCNYNDHSAPDLTVENIIKKAKELKLQTIAFTEHVRNSSDWTENYIEEINQFLPTADLNVLKGFEAKILPDGSIDCPSRYLNGDYLIVASFHTKYQEKDKWYNALLKAINNESVNVIGHLEHDHYFSLNYDEIKRIGEEVLSNGKIVEINTKYHRPPLEYLKVFIELGISFHLGSDAHSLNEIGNFDRIMDLINFIEQSKG